MDLCKANTGVDGDDAIAAYKEKEKKEESKRCQFCGMRRSKFFCGKVILADGSSHAIK